MRGRRGLRVIARDYRCYFNPRPHAGATNPDVSEGAGTPNFNPRPHAGATGGVVLFDFVQLNFNPRPHAGATPHVDVNGGGPQFQSTPPCGGDTPATQMPSWALISIHAPMRGRPSTAARWDTAPNFNPRPHAGATAREHDEESAAPISIHAPMRGRRHCCSCQLNTSYFNPRPHAGATQMPMERPWVLRDFNPRPHAGATGNRPMGDFAGVFQSTPPCGGDFCKCLCLGSHGISIHAPMRGRLCPGSGPGKDGPFQSTPPCGGDYGAERRGSKGADFNPRPHAGATVSLGANSWVEYNFNPRPHAGATFRPGIVSQANLISIHAPMRGRPWPKPLRLPTSNFNPRPHAGATAVPYHHHLSAEDFNPRPHAGATDIHEYICIGNFYISIHAPMRGRRERTTPKTSTAVISIHAPMRGRPINQG